MSQTGPVTGGSGFIGSHVARQLAERGDRVINFDQRPPVGEAAWWLDPVSPNVRFVSGDIGQWPELLSAVRDHRPESIVHTAAIANPAAVQHKPLLALRVNVE